VPPLEISDEEVIPLIIKQAIEEAKKKFPEFRKKIVI